MSSGPLPPENVTAPTHVVSALVARHAELAGEVQAAERRVARLRADLAHLEGTLRPFDPEFRPADIRSKRVAQRDERFAHGELPRLVLDTLRTAPGLDAGDARLLDNGRQARRRLPAAP